MFKTNFAFVALLSLVFNPMLSMGGPSEPYGSDYKNESKLSNSEPEISATITYQADGAEVKVHRLNVNGKAKLKNVFLKRKKTNVQCSIKMQNLREIEFIGTEGTSLLAKIKHKNGDTAEEYLFNSSLKFCGALEAELKDETTECTFEAKNLKKIVFDNLVQDKKTCNKKTVPLKEVLDADKNEPLSNDAPTA